MCRHYDSKAKSMYAKSNEWVKVKARVKCGRRRHKHAFPSSCVTPVFSSDASDKMRRAEPTPWWEGNKAANTRPNTFLFVWRTQEDTQINTNTPQVRPGTWTLCLLPGKPESRDRKWRKAQWRAQLTSWLGRTQTKTITRQRFGVCYGFLSEFWRAFWGGDVAAYV